MKPNTLQIKARNATSKTRRSSGPAFPRLVEKCTCAHAYQDQTYGPFMRVKNALRKAAKETTQRHRCTVCATVS